MRFAARQQHERSVTHEETLGRMRHTRATRNVPAETSVQDLRMLRDRATRLNATVRADLQSFLQDDQLTFRRRPGSDRTDVNVTTSCTVHMALASNELLKELYPRISI